jgi:hypothetical protein
MKASMEPPSPTRSQFFADHEGSARKQLKLITFGLALATFSLALAMLSGCAPYSGTMAAESREQLSFVDLMDKSDLAPRAGVGPESQAKAAEAVRFITQDDLPRASHTINAALQLDERNSWLHFLNGFIYQLEARQGDSQKGDLVIEGCRTALRLGNWIEQEFLDLAYLDLKQFGSSSSRLY